MAPSLREQKVAQIFHKFDKNRDGRLNREEMSSLVIAVNPRVQFSDDQIVAILDEVFRTYGDYIDPYKGLSLEGLLQTYDDGAGDVDRDFDALNLAMAKKQKKEEEAEAEGTYKDDAEEDKSDAVSSPGDDRNPNLQCIPNPNVPVRRKRSVGSWAGSPKNGIAYDDTWRLVEDLEMLIRRLEMKMEAKVHRKLKKLPYLSSFGLSRRDLTSFSDRKPSSEMGISEKKPSSEMVPSEKKPSLSPPSTVEVLMNRRRPWEELGVDYTNFLKGLAEIREKANSTRTQEEAFDAHMAIGRSLFDHRLYKEALVSFQKSSELKPTDVRPHFQCGNALYSLFRVSEARESYMLALEAGEIAAGQWNSILPQIHVNLGIALEGEGMLLSASEHYKEAAIREPKHFRALKHLGSALYGCGEFKAAKKALNEAVFLNPEYSDAHCDLGSTLHALGDHDEAVKEFEKAIELKQDHIEAIFNLATLYKDTGKFQRAADTYGRVLALEGNHWRAELNRAVSLLGAGHVEEAKKAFKSAYKMTRRSELYEAIVHLKQMERRPPKGLSGFLRRGEENGGMVGESFRASEENSVTISISRIRRANAQTTPCLWLARALEIRKLQRSTRLNKLDTLSVKKEIVQSNLPVSSSGIGTAERSIRKEALEKVLRKLLHFLSSEAFQGSMKSINEKVLTLLDTSESGRVDLGMVFAMLAPLCGGALDKRKRTAFDALVWRSSNNRGGEISREDAHYYIRTLRLAYFPAQEHSDSMQESVEGGEEDRETSISYPEFIELFDDLESGFGVLNILARLEVQDRVRRGRRSCSVCLYPIVGPRFKEVRAGFSLCSICYSSGKVPLASKQEEYCFKEYHSDVEKGRFKFFRSRTSSDS